MINLKILNSKEKKKLLDNIKEQYGVKKLDLDYVFLRNNDNKIFILSNDFAKLDTKDIRINSLGLYFAKIHPSGIRLSIEGTQIIGPLAKSNVLMLNDDEIKLWVRGNDIATDKKFSIYVIIRHNNDYFGSGIYKDGKVRNMISKDRLIKK
ncbi:hypothetical protein HYX17_04615 [Candidatus Woesearchaeota archaeon]|nr:hypothetical protein [Candidatus Woesearchaeota archaeon]